MKTEELKEYFTCRCPDDLKNGVGGYMHRVPIDCCRNEKEAEGRRASREARRKGLVKGWDDLY